MSYKVEEVQPHIWTTEEAYRSGKTAYRIKVDMNGNPFKGHLGDLWIKGWKEAAASDTTSTKRIDYTALENFNERNSRSRDPRPRRGGFNRNHREDER